MSSRAGPLALLGLAVDGLRRKPGRNLLTMSGVFIGVFALTLIVALGQGLASILSDTVSGEANLRQIGLSPGFGHRISGDRELQIEGEMSEARRARLRRAGLARRRPGTFIGRRSQVFTPELLEGLLGEAHIELVMPIVLERYRIEMGELVQETGATLGIRGDPTRYQERILAGRLFRDDAADEVLIHEYLAYQWGFVSEEEIASLVGRRITLSSLGGAGRSPFADLVTPETIGRLMQEVDLGRLSEEERRLLPGIVQKLVEGLRGGPVAEDGEAAPAVTEDLEIVGVIRELEPSDPFNVIEDGNAFQVDLFLPQQTANRLFQANPINRELGYGRALVMVDRAENAPRVEERLREAGYTAFSVASAIERVEGVLGTISVVVAFLTGIALLVAALGIINTMVTSVLERTREIGLWKAVGATGAQVRVVFLLEAAMIGLFGGLLGLGIALLVMLPGNGIAREMIARQTAFPFSGDVFVVPPWLLLAGPLLATVVAMLAALYPAFRASRVDPVRALRHD